MKILPNDKVEMLQFHALSEDCNISHFVTTRHGGVSQQQNYLHGVDALVTNVPDVCIAVLAADCVPVLLYAPDVKAVAAVHAGWRGTVQQIVAKAVRLLREEYGADPRLMKAAIAPSIGPVYY